MDKVDIETLGATVTELTKTLAGRLEAGNHPKPSFSPDAPATYPADPQIQETRNKLIDTLTDLLHLATGAGDYFFLHGGLFMNFDATVLDVLNQFDFFSKVPLHGSAKYSDIARATNIPEALVLRIFRYAFIMRLFAPETPGGDRVVHTAYSAYMARMPVVRSWVGHALEEGRPASVKTADALKRFNAGLEHPTEEMTETAFSLSWPARPDGSLADFWQMGEDEPWRANRFADAMQASVLSATIHADDIVEKFDWASLGDATVVDVGGSEGSLAKMLAQKHPQLKFVVQDLPRLEKDFIANQTEDLASRVSFQPQNFFDAQPQQAEVFLMKHVLHNWPDKHAVQILGNLVAALKPKGRIIVCDSVVPTQQEAEALPLNMKKCIAAADVQMFAFLNSKERTVEDWERLAKRADSRLRLANTHIVPGAIVSLLELVLDA